jgi:hypothetical protein
MRDTDGVREAITAVDREVTKLAAHTSAEAAPALDGLRSSWGILVEILALGPPPERRTCPHCGNVGVLAAIRCSRCWLELVPPQGGPA